MKPITLLFFIACLVGISPTNISAQRSWNLEWQAGVTFNLHQSLRAKSHKFPGFKIFTSLQAKNRIKDWTFVNYGGMLTISHKSIGNSLNPLNEDIQIDFSNSLSLAFHTKEEGDSRKFMRTFGINKGYNLSHSQEYLFAISSIYNFNFSGRNQMVGAWSGTVKDVSFTYYNDGAAPINLFPISDNFDRYWTGGIHVFFHKSTMDYNYLEISMDQFTGYLPKLYELASMFGIALGGYNSKADIASAAAANQLQRQTSTSYNSSEVNIRVAFDPNYSINTGFLGSLVYKGRYFGLQDIIHSIMGLSVHPNRDENKFYLGANYNSALWKGTN